MKVYGCWFKDSDGDMRMNVCSTEHGAKKWIVEQMRLEVESSTNLYSQNFPRGYEAARKAFLDYEQEYDVYTDWNWEEIEIQGMDYDPDNTRIKW